MNAWLAGGHAKSREELAREEGFRNDADRAAGGAVLAQNAARMLEDTDAATPK